jgi:predicted RNase H-like nuclease
MRQLKHVVGVDGCRGGWVVCTLTDCGVSFEVVGSFGDIGSDGALCCVDMPVGLCDGGGRGVDAAAKGVLGRWHSRVFQTPARAVFDAADYRVANAVSREVSGRGLSKQAWHIMPKVREVDGVLRGDGVIRSVVRECHPEICFWGLSGAVIVENKKTDEGAAARLGVLGGFVEDVEGVVAGVLARWPRKVLARDDVIDALVCAVTAAGVWDGSLRTLPEQPERDAYGLAMEMVYRDGQAMVRR